MTFRILRAATFWSLLLSVCGGCSTADQSEPVRSSSQVVVGQLLLPAGNGPRGIQVVIGVVADDASVHHEWLVLDEEYRFRKSFIGRLKEFEVVAGIDKTVFEISDTQLARLSKLSKVDVGDIDLRERLQARKFRLLTEDGSNKTLRIGMWFGKPPAGVSLGSRQFPEMESGAEASWLLPREFDGVYWLAEEPIGEKRGRHWRSGKQTLFGPFVSSELPAELTIE